LTFGGVISGNRMKTPQMLEIFESLIIFARENSLKKIVYKTVPHIYHWHPSEEDLYALFRNEARLIRRDVSTTIRLRERLSLSKGRKWTINQSRKTESKYTRVLTSRLYAARSRSFGGEIQRRAGSHGGGDAVACRTVSENIKLFGAFADGEMLAGTIVYASTSVAHAQYMAACEAGKQAFALDAVLQF
jgi:hypothetical protein